MAIDPIFSDTLFFYPPALVATGVTDTCVITEQNTASCTSVVFQTTVASIGTNVVVRFEGSLDGTNFFNLDSLGDTTITSNSTTGYNVQNCPLKAVRCRLVSISGGTPTVTFKIAAK